MIETEPDGTQWAKCIYKDEHPEIPRHRIYHPNAKEDYTGNYGSDSHYSCPDCGKTWWVERDG